MSDETRSPDEPESPSGGADKPKPDAPSPENPETQVPEEVSASPAAETAESETPAPAAGSSAAAEDAPAPEGAADAPAEVQAEEPSPAESTETAVELAGSGEPAEAPAETEATDESATPAEQSITTPEEAEAFVRSVRAAVPATLPEELATGQEVRGLVKELEGEDAVIDVGEGRFEIRLPKLEFVDASGKVSVAQGDSIDLVLEELGDPPTFKRRTSAIGEAIGKIAEAFAERKPLEGKVTSSIKGGFEVKVEGVRAFLPGSQATLRRSDDKGKLVGETLPVMVTKFDPSGRSIVVSRRKILEKERKQQARDTREKLAKGAVFPGRVVALQAYGAFVDIGGLQGLLHLTEISWSRLRKPDEALKVGQRIDVKVLEHDESGKKISLSMRALLEDPWKSLGSEVQPNQVRSGKLLRVVKSGAIVELAPGVEARLALSELAPEGQLAPEKKKELVGSELLVQVVDYDAKRHRASLLLAPEGAETGSIVEPPEVKAGAKLKGIVERSAPFGLFLRLAPGKLGLLHATESNTPPGTDLGKEFPPGTPLQVEVLEVNEEEGRIRLTRRTAFDRMKDRERQKARQGRGGPGGPGGRGRGDRRGGGRRDSGPLVNPASAPKGGGFASFGDLLKSALGGGAEPPAEEAVSRPSAPEAPAAESAAPAEAQAPEAPASEAESPAPEAAAEAAAAGDSDTPATPADEPAGEPPPAT